MFFSGEIFNKAELGFGELSDAEVLAAVYRKQGVEGFAKIRGAFAFAIEDGAKTILVRDQFGSVPFYYYIPAQPDARPLCSTSVRDLLEHGVPRKLSREGFFSYLAYGGLYAPYTMVESVRIVPPGCYVVVAEGEVTESRYWTPSFELKAWKQDELQEAVNTIIASALEEQSSTPYATDASVTPAAFLSGGIDSSSIVANWRKQFDGEIRTYCVIHEDPRTDERKWARMVAERNHTKHTEMMLEDRMISEWLDEAVASYDQPSLDGLNFWFATRLLKQSSEKLVFSGEGGDELFMGYGQFLKHRLAYKYAPMMRFLPKCLGRLVGAFAPNEKVRKLAMLVGLRMDPYYVPRRILSDRQITEIARAELLIGLSQLEDIGLTAHPEAPTDDLLNRISWFEMQTVTADFWMRDGFQTSSSNGIAIRTPLCDVRLAELLYTASGAMKCDVKMSKPLLVRASGEGIPQECVIRKKQGFALPFDRYFSGEIKDRIDTFIAGDDVRLFIPEAIRQIGRQYRAGRINWARVWALFMAEDWCRRNRIDL